MAFVMFALYKIQFLYFRCQFQIHYKALHIISLAHNIEVSHKMFSTDPFLHFLLLERGSMRWFIRVVFGPSQKIVHGLQVSIMYMPNCIIFLFSEHPIKLVNVTVKFIVTHIFLDSALRLT